MHRYTQWNSALRKFKMSYSKLVVIYDSSAGNYYYCSRLLEAPGATTQLSSLWMWPLSHQKLQEQGGTTTPKVSTCIFSVDGNRITYYHENYILPIFLTLY